MQPATRVMVFDRLDAYLFDLDPRKVLEATYVSEVNAEHSLTIVTTTELAKTNRLLVRDGMGAWHEYVVTGTHETHAGTKDVQREYYCVWSLQYDLSGTFVDNQYGCGIVPGHASVPKPARTAMDIAVGGTSRWQVGSVTVSTLAAASFYRRSGWEALKTVIEKWGGELQATITVDKTGVVSRSVDLLTQVGASTATRRFDYGHDVTSIKRSYAESIWPCRIIPLGKSQETEAGGYTRRPSIESVNGGCMWLEDSAITPLVRVPDGNGGYEYPTLIVENDTYEEPADLKAWALEHITEYTRPQVSYEANVAQFVRAGLNPHGVALGDAVVVVDHTFDADGLRIDARLKRETGDLYDASKTVLTIGTVARKMSTQLSRLKKQVDRMAETTDRSTWYQATDDYLSNLLGRINYCVNADGGYTYITEGEGIRTYDYPVSDPLVGDEATKVVEVKGGTIRIANSRTPGGDWDWKTVFVSGHVAAALVTAAQIVAGYIRSPNGTFIDLDNDTAQLGATASGHAVFDSEGMEVFNANGDSMLYAGVDSGGNPLARIGDEASSNIMLTPGLVEMVTYNGDDVLVISDGRDTNGYVTVTETFTNANSASFYTALPVASNLGTGAVKIATADGVDVSCSRATVTNDRGYISLTPASTVIAAAEVVVTYYVQQKWAGVAVAIGRSADVNGVGSFVVGKNAYAYHYSLALGNWAYARARECIAIGTNAEVAKNADFGIALGWGAEVENPGDIDISTRINPYGSTTTEGYGKLHIDAATGKFSIGRMITDTVLNNTISLSSGWSASSISYSEWGKVAMLTIYVKNTSTVSVNPDGTASKQIGTIVTGRRPKSQVTVGSTDPIGSMYYISSAGAVYLKACEGTGSSRTISTLTTFGFGVTYLLA